MARFRCRLTGNIFEFTTEYDIADMREHPQYTEVEEIEDGLQTEEKQNTKKEVKKTTKKSKAEDK